MKIVIAPDSFKGSNTSIEAASHIEIGVKKVFADAEIIKIPIADGGEGTVEALVSGTGGQFYSKDVAGPMGSKVKARFGILLNGICVIEMAAASGLPLVLEHCRNPLLATTYGVGELIAEAMDKGCKTIIIGLGGSATNDGGVGMAQALGCFFKDGDGNELGFGGGPLARLATIDIDNMDKRIEDTNIIIASDVTCPLYGKTGASEVFGPQKGADADMVKQLDSNLLRLAKIARIQLNSDLANMPGSGAAGGLGYGLMTFCGAKMKNGIETVLEVVAFDQYLENCDLIITGEGRIDSQSIFGKVPVGVARHGKKYNIPVLAIVGTMGTGAEAVYEFGIDSIMSSVNKIISLEEAMSNSGAMLEDAAQRAMRMIKIGMDMGKQHC